tara:strand:- start:1057 stop:1680 length:624 start_codon:yes stop_codon:yes gene_type:complete
MKNNMFMPGMKAKLDAAVKNGTLIKFKDKITAKTISDKIKNPINVNSPISLSVLDEKEWLRGLSHGWAKTQGGHYLEYIVAAVSPISGWVVKKVGNKIDLQNTNTKEAVMLKTQPSTANQSANMGDKQKAGQASSVAYKTYAIVFFKPQHEAVIQNVFGFTKDDIKEIKLFLIEEFRTAREAYEQQIKAHPDYARLIAQLSKDLDWL